MLQNCSQSASPATKKAPRARVEEPIHTAILNFLQWQLPRAIIHHSPNETDQSGLEAMLMVKRAKKLGMRPGWPDLEFLLGGKMYFLEVKAPGNPPSEDQLKCHAELEAGGARVAVVHSVDEARAALICWGLLAK